MLASLLVAAFALSVQAVPNQNGLFKRDCNRNDCFRQVFGTVSSGQAASGTAACSSFFKATVTPCPVTSTVVQTSTVTTATSTVTSAAVGVTSTASTTITVTTTPTVTTTIVSTVTSTDGAQMPTPLKHKNKRAAACSTTQTPSSVPAFASACTGTRFSSVCACQGFTTATTVLVPVTTTSTSITTVSVVATSTVITTNMVTTTFTMTSAFATPLTSTVMSTTTVVVPGASQPDCVPKPGETRVSVRIEGGSGTLFEGFACAGGKVITTNSGGTHNCDGTNNGANPTPGGNGITLIDATGLFYDGTYSAQFDDFFIQTIGSQGTSNNQFWGILVNEVFTQAGGCETKVYSDQRLLWAFNAFNVNYFLTLAADKTTVTAGQSVTFTVLGSNGDSGAVTPISGAKVAGSTSDSAGKATVTFNTKGTYSVKATRSDSIRSNAQIIQVV